MENEKLPEAEYDGPWKEALEKYFEAFMLFFFPVVHAAIDWARGYEFLDKELEKCMRGAALGQRRVDKLIKVYLPDGRETWLLIHIEIQGYYDKDFKKRMFIYYYRLFDRYAVEVVSMAVLSDDDPNYRPGEYRTERWGCEHIFRFPVAKVLDYGEDWERLERDPNPFAMVVMAHLKALEVKDGRERKRWKLHLIRLLYERGYEKKDILELFRFIDWLLALPDDLEEEFNQDVIQMEEKKMPYVTSVERLGIKKGVLQGASEILLKVIETRFRVVPEDLASSLKSIRAQETLEALVQEAVTCQSIDAFRKAISEAHGN